jgi:broad specificity phosphatase PhoE
LTAVTTTALLIRHGETDAVGAWLAGRDVSTPLNQAGRAQAERLCARLRGVHLSAIYSSPLERALETAAPLARERALMVEPKLEWTEVDFGKWTGARFDQLTGDPAWERFNRHRSFADVPDGERAVDVQARVVRVLDQLRVRHPNETVAVVSHADVIRLGILYIAGVPVDFIHRFEISPASVTAVALHEGGATLRYVNCSGCS